MSGPWYAPGMAVERNWTPGDVLEMKCMDDSGDIQGHTIMLIQAQEQEKDIVMAHLLHIECDYYAWWMREAAGHPNPGRYRCVQAGKKGARAPDKVALAVGEWHTLSTGNKLPYLDKLE